MKAIRVRQFGEPSVLVLEDVPDPLPAPGQVVVRAHAVGVNPVDTYIRAGIYGARPFPFTPGMDAAGLVQAVGAGVTDLSVGQRVYVAGSVSGAYAQLIVCNATHVHPLPDRLSFAQGAAIGVPAATAYRALFDRAQALPGETVLIHGGTGGVGLAAIQLARAHGMTVFATGGTPQGRELLLQQGAHYALDHRDGGYLQELMKLTGGKGVDVILEMLANVNLGKDLTVLARHGRVVVIGSRGNVEINPRDTMSRDADIRGMSLLFLSDEDHRRIHRALVAAMEAGIVRPVIAAELPLADAPKAHEMVMSAHAPGKIVLLP